MVDVHGVVGSAAAGESLVANEAGVSQAAHVEAMLAVVPLAPLLTSQLADAVDRIRVHDGDLRRVVVRRIGAKYGDGVGMPNIGVSLINAELALFRLVTGGVLLTD